LLINYYYYLSLMKFVDGKIDVELGCSVLVVCYLWS